MCSKLVKFLFNPLRLNLRDGKSYHHKKYLCSGDPYHEQTNWPRWEVLTASVNVFPKWPRGFFLFLVICCCIAWSWMIKRADKGISTSTWVWMEKLFNVHVMITSMQWLIRRDWNSLTKNTCLLSKNYFGLLKCISCKCLRAQLENPPQNNI